MTMFIEYDYRKGKTACSRSLGPSYIVIYYMRWVNTFWIHSILNVLAHIITLDLSDNLIFDDIGNLIVLSAN